MTVKNKGYKLPVLALVFALALCLALGALAESAFPVTVRDALER